MAVVETDMCGVDAIQFLTGCTFGKGNLIHHDYGKNAYTFHRRSDGHAIRVAGRPEPWAPDPDPEHQDLFARLRSGEATEEDEARVVELHEARPHALLARDPGELFTVTEVDGPPPSNAPLRNQEATRGAGAPQSRQSCQKRRHWLLRGAGAPDVAHQLLRGDNLGGITPRGRGGERRLRR